MDYGSIVYVTPDDVWRNAAVVTDHRGTTRPGGWNRPTTTVISSAPPPGTVSTLATVPAATVAQTGPYQYGYPIPGTAPTWNQSGWWNPAQPPYVMPPVMGAPSNLATILGGFGDVGSLANILAQVFAALLPLPTAPTPQDANDSDASVNAAVNSSNLIRYQQALATFARRDQQILTIGSVLKELLKRPGFITG